MRSSLKVWLFGLLLMNGSAVAANDPHLIGAFEAWRAYKLGAGLDATCYAFSEPVERLPTGLRRGPAYLFVNYGGPGPQGSEEISLAMGFPLNAEARPALKVDAVEAALMAKDENAWLQDVEEHSSVVAALKKGLRAKVEALSKRGNRTTDIYALNGFSAAYKAIKRACQRP